MSQSAWPVVIPNMGIDLQPKISATSNQLLLLFLPTFTVSEPGLWWCTLPLSSAGCCQRYHLLSYWLWIKCVCLLFTRIFETFLSSGHMRWFTCWRQWWLLFWWIIEYIVFLPKCDPALVIDLIEMSALWLPSWGKHHFFIRLTGRWFLSQSLQRRAQLERSWGRIFFMWSPIFIRSPRSKLLKRSVSPQKSATGSKMRVILGQNFAELSLFCAADLLATMLRE